MLLGQFERAWLESDLSAARRAHGTHQLWDMGSFAGKRVMVRCLHGYGDAIQFIRYLPLLRREAADVIVEAAPELAPLLQFASGAGRTIGWERDPTVGRSKWDRQIEIMELPWAFRTTLDTIPSGVPYFDIPVSGKRLPEAGKPKVGLIWAASSWNPARSMRLSQLTPVTEIPELSFFSFQRGAERVEVSGLPFIFDTAEISSTILDTARDLREIDLLITVDTMAAHLGGALGRPVWLLLPFEADWRWMLDRDDSPWYPTMKIFRQPHSGSGWEPVIDRVAAELAVHRWR